MTRAEHSGPTVPAPHADISADPQSAWLNWRELCRWELLVPLVIFLAQAVWLFDFSIDDAGISFRYAQHLAEGYGLRWNPEGPAVEGYSNFLWVLILAAGKLGGVDIELFAHILGAVFGVAGLLVLHRLCARVWRPRPFWWFPVLLVAACPVWALWVMSGLEIALFGLFLLLAVYALTMPLRQRTFLLSIGLVGLLLTRPEGIALSLLPLIVGGIAERRESRSHLRRAYVVPALVVAAAAAGLLLFRLAYFGYPVANTVYAKFSPTLPAAGEVGKWLIFGLPFFAAWVIAYRSRTILPYGAAQASAVGLALGQMILVLPVVPVMYFLHRYQIAFLPFLVLAVPLMLNFLAEKKRLFGVLAGIALLVWTVQEWPAVARRHQSERYAIGRQRCVAESLVSLPERVTVALLDAGRIPYWSDLPSYDVWGLCDIDIAHRGFSYESTLGRNPDVYVMSVNIDSGKVYPRLGYDIMISGNPTFKDKFEFWRICGGTPPTIEWYYDYAIFINTDWATRHGLSLQKINDRPRIRILPPH